MAWVASFLLLFGSAFMLVAAIGVARFPDVLTRMHATTKAGTLGVGCLMGAAALEFDELAVTVQVIVIALFFLLTAPVATHRIGRAAHQIGVPLWEGTQRDDLGEAVGPRASFSPESLDPGATAGPLTGDPVSGGTSQPPSPDSGHGTF